MNTVVIVLCAVMWLGGWAALVIGRRARADARRALLRAERAVAEATAKLDRFAELHRERREVVLVVGGEELEEGYELPDPGATVTAAEGERALLRSQQAAASAPWRALANTVDAMKAKHTGAYYITRERERRAGNGYDADYDDTHAHGELLMAAVAYALAYPRYTPTQPPVDWPLDAEEWDPADNHVDNLIMAGALIAAEIDRLKRAL